MLKYPNLNSAKIISFDIETYDPLLMTEGPGVYRRDGNILGVAIATDDGFSEYYSIDHAGSGQDPKHNKAYIKTVMGNNVPKVGANIMYDIDWIENWWGIKVNGELHDVQVAEPLIDEYAKSYSLDALSEKYLSRHKEKTSIDKFMEDNKLKGNDPRPWLYMMPYDIVAGYAKTDANLPIEILKRQQPILKRENIADLYRMECDLLRLLLHMRKVGVRIDAGMVEHNTRLLSREIKSLENKMFTAYGEFNYNSSKQIAEKFDLLGIEYPLTEKGNPSIDTDLLDNIARIGSTTDEYMGSGNNSFNNLANDKAVLANLIRRCKAAKKTRDTFMQGSLTKFRVGDRIHCQFFPLRNDSNGTISGRFSSAKPNLQQIPARNKKHTKLCRQCFIPEVGYDWAKLDWSQIEYRFIAHYAVGEGSEDMRQRYNNDSDTDFHKVIMDLTGLERKPAKNLSFGAAYYMGAPVCAKKYHWSLDKATELLATYHREVPFVSATRDKVLAVAKGRGYIKTILNRRARVNGDMRENHSWHKMFNRLTQGAAADLMKKSMLKSWEAGVYDILVPHITVHDELNVSSPKTKEGDEAVKELKYIMENSIKISVPIKVDVEIGKNWFDVDSLQG